MQTCGMNLMQKSISIDKTQFLAMKNYIKAKEICERFFLIAFENDITVAMYCNVSWTEFKFNLN